MGNKELEDLTVEQVVSSVAEHLDADVIHYNGPVQRPADTQLIQECITRRRRKNILLLLVTTGGDADPAYRIARCLQTKYERFFSMCRAIAKALAPSSLRGRTNSLYPITENSGRSMCKCPRRMSFGKCSQASLSWTPCQHYRTMHLTPSRNSF